MRKPLQKKKCEWCGRVVTVRRSDNKWCSDKCRKRSESEAAKFITPIIPKSGIPGVTFKRASRKWEVRIPFERDKNGNMKYVGSFKLLHDALNFRNEVING